jgi:hypothetical protein
MISFGRIESQDHKRRANFAEYAGKQKTTPRDTGASSVTNVTPDLI